MVRAERFELPTFWFVARRSIQLSYARRRYHHRLPKGVKNSKLRALPGRCPASKRRYGTPLLVWTDFPFAGEFRG
jgi:hypothetical protein